MFINTLLDTDGSQCLLTYEETGPWLRATWRGFVDPDEAMRGAENYLAHAGPFHCPCLLNDNLALRGPWFDSVEWLERAWLPRARDLGLRYVAHVVQEDRHADILTLTYPRHLIGALEVQLFERVADAERWLRNCQPGAAPQQLSA